MKSYAQSTGSERNKPGSPLVVGPSIQTKSFAPHARSGLSWSASTMDRVFERAALCGLETEYRDAFGNLRTFEPEVLTRLLEALGTGRGAADRILPRSILIIAYADHTLRMAHAQVPTLPSGYSLRP